MFFFVYLIVCWCFRHVLDWCLNTVFNYRFRHMLINATDAAQTSTTVASNDEMESPTNQVVADLSEHMANEGVQFRSRFLLDRVVGGVGLLLFIFHMQWATAWICSSVIEKLLNYKEQSLPEWRMNQAKRRLLTNDKNIKPQRTWLSSAEDPRPMSHLLLMFLIIQVIYCLCLLEYKDIHVLRDTLPVYILLSVMEQVGSDGIELYVWYKGIQMKDYNTSSICTKLKQTYVYRTMLWSHFFVGVSIRMYVVPIHLIETQYIPMFQKFNTYPFLLYMVLLLFCLYIGKQSRKIAQQWQRVQRFEIF